MSTKTNAFIAGVGMYVPPYILTNAELELLVDTNSNWIRERTGIEQRHILKNPHQATAFMATEAIKDLCKKTNLNPVNIDCIICCTITPDMFFPSTANLIATALGCPQIASFDLLAACSGFIYGLSVASAYIECGRYKKVVLVGADKMSSIIDYQDRSTCVLFGDGAGAVLLEPTTLPVGLIDTVLQSDGSGANHLNLKAGGSLNPASQTTLDNKQHYVYQEGSAVYKHAVLNLIQIVKTILTRNQLQPTDVAWLVPHQANKRIIEAVAERLDFDMSKVVVNIERYGNTTAATIPICLYEWEQQFKKDDLIIAFSFGAGFTWGASLIKWGY